MTRKELFCFVVLFVVMNCATHGSSTYFSHDIANRVVVKRSTDPFTTSSNWHAYNAGTTGEVGYAGAVYDGRYVYYVPYNNISNFGFHGRALRYDTQFDFTDPTAWTAYDAGNTNGLVTKGYNGGLYDGRYVYFVPIFDGAVYHGRVLRYDTTTSFTNASSWSAYDAGSTSGLNSKGYNYGVFDNRYLYFVPFSTVHNTGWHGVVLQYDTQSDFTSPSSWVAYDAGNTSGLSTKGYVGGAFDGQYVYFCPYFNGTAHGNALRYDTTQPFNNSASWVAYDAGSTNGYITRGMVGAIYVAPYVYFTPNENDASPFRGIDGIVLRYNTQGSGFTNPASWSAYDASTTNSMTTIGFGNAVSDGRYIYFIPYNNAT